MTTKHTSNTTPLDIESPLYSEGQGVIPSVAIDRVITLRNEGVKTYMEGLEMLVQARSLLSQAAGSDKLYGFDKIAADATRWEDKPERAEKAISKLVDGKIWDRLMRDTGMYTLMSNKQRDAFSDQINGKDMPEITLDNVLATFKALHAGKVTTFEDGIIDVFRALSWDYKTNCPCKLGKKIIVSGFLQTWRNSGPSFGIEGQTKLDDLARPFYLLEQKNVPDHRISEGQTFSDFFRKQGCGELYEGEYFTVRAYLRGTAHITFKNIELVEKINDIVARRFPNMLPPRV